MQVHGSCATAARSGREARGNRAAGGWGKPPGGRVEGTGTRRERGPGGRGKLFERIAAAEGQRGGAVKRISIGDPTCGLPGNRARGIEGAGVSPTEKTGMFRA